MMTGAINSLCLFRTVAISAAMMLQVHTYISVVCLCIRFDLSSSMNDTWLLSST